MDTIEGKWWIHGAEQSAEFGALALDDSDGLSLLVKVPQSLSTEQVVAQGLGNVEGSCVPDVVFGRDSHNKPVTLFGCYSFPAISAGLRTYKIGVLAAVQGLELRSWSECCIRAVSMSVELLHRWLGARILQPVPTAAGTPAWTEERQPDLVFELCPAIRARIVRFVGEFSSQDEHKWIARYRMWIHFETPISLDEVTRNWVPWISRFFSLLIGASVRCHDIRCYIKDPYAESSTGLVEEGKLIQKREGQSRESPDVHIQGMLASYHEIADSFSGIIKTWYQVASELEPVIDLFSIIGSKRSLHSEAQFLFLVQALEVYHARRLECVAISTEEHRRRVDLVVDAVPPELRDWLRRKIQAANYKPLDERLSELFRRYLADAQRLFSDLEGLAERIRYTRNYLTHYTGDVRSPKYLKPDELVEVNWHLRTFIWICLLRELGISGQPIERLITRRTGVHFVMLQ